MLPPKTSATLIRKSPLTETSLIVHWCTDDTGLLKTVAKGGRRTKSPFAGKLDLFFRCEIELVPARKSDLHILKDVRVENSRLGIRKTWLQTLAASYFIKLVEKVSEPETPIPEAAGLLGRALDYLAENPPDLRAVSHFEKQLAASLGLDERDALESIADTFGDIPTQRGELVARLEC